MINPADQTHLKRVLDVKGPHLGLMYLASMLEKFSWKVKVIDDSLFEYGAEKIAKLVSKLSPIVVGITAVTSTIKNALRYLSKIKELIPNVLTVIGGPHATFLPYETLRSSKGLDVVVRGEGEETVVDLMDKYSRKEHKGLAEVRGIVYRDGSRLIANPPRPLIENLDSLPFPARHLVPYEKYRYGKYVLGTIVSSRGCPYSCTFCSSSLLMGKKFRARSPRNVVDEIEELVYKYKVSYVEFLDDTYTLNKKRAVEIAREIRRRKLDIKYVVSSRVNIVDKAMLVELKKSGCDMIYYGVESASQRILDKMKKGTTVEQAERAIRATKEVGIKCTASFIIGYPGETLEEIDRTIKFSIKLDPDYSQYSILTPYPGTPIFHELSEKGLIDTYDWDKYTILDPVINYEKLGLSKKLVMRKLSEAYYRFYFRPKYLAKHLNLLATALTTPIKLMVHALLKSTYST